MKLALDHHFSTSIAIALRSRGHEVVIANEVGWHVLADDELLERCVDERCALLTNNARDLIPIVREWSIDGRGHFGLVLSSDARLPRTKDGSGRFIELLDELLTANPASDAFADRVVWLG